MKKCLVFILFLIIFSIFGGFLLGQTEEPTVNFSGKWSVRWLSNDSQNPLNLSHKGDLISGNYTNDNNASCLVSGKVATCAGGIFM